MTPSPFGFFSNGLWNEPRIFTVESPFSCARTIVRKRQGCVVRPTSTHILTKGPDSLFRHNNGKWPVPCKWIVGCSKKRPGGEWLAAVENTQLCESGEQLQHMIVVAALFENLSFIWYLVPKSAVKHGSFNFNTVDEPQLSFWLDLGTNWASLYHFNMVQ